MATGVTAESVLGSIIRGHLECSICHTRFQEPKMLDCSHSFCLKCLQKLIKSQNPDKNKITCPLCQREFILPKEGVAKLNNNYTLITLVEEVTKQEQLLKGEGSKVICQTCDEENEAISRCMDCEHYLCKECQKAHQRWAVLRTHKIVTLAEQGDEFVPENESKKNISKCENHSRQELCYYCNTCEQLICKQCAASTHKEPMHTFVDFSTAIDNCLQDVCDYEKLSQMDRCSAYTTSKIFSNWESLSNRLGIMTAETKSQITKKAQMKISKIKQNEKLLMQEAQVTYKTKHKKLSQFMFAQKAMEMEKSSMTNASRLDMLRLRQELLHDYKDVLEEQTQAVTHDLSFIGFMENQDEGLEVGKLVLEEKWELLTTSIDVFGRFIESLSTGDVLVVNKSQQQLTRLSLNGKVLHTCAVNQLEGQDPNKITHPTGVAVNKDDQLIILLESAVEIFDKEYHLLRQFTPGEESDIRSTPTCLAVDDSNLIAVGYKDKEIISLHNPDGSLIRTLPAPMIDEYLTISNQQIIYTSSERENNLMCIDYMGNETFTVDTAGNSCPFGVCCDRAGDIYVVSYFKDKYDTDHYNVEGCYIETVVDNLGLVQGTCCDITYTTGGKLAVSGAGHTKIYHKV